jgi:hypothetical protein
MAFLVIPCDCAVFCASAYGRRAHRLRPQLARARVHCRLERRRLVDEVMHRIAVVGGERRDKGLTAMLFASYQLDRRHGLDLLLHHLTDAGHPLGFVWAQGKRSHEPPLPISSHFNSFCYSRS